MPKLGKPSFLFPSLDALAPRASDQTYLVRYGRIRANIATQGFVCSAETICDRFYSRMNVTFMMTL